MVITKFKIFEASSLDDIGDNFIVSTPSGEIIETHGVDLSKMEDINYVFKITKDQQYYQCADYHSDKIREFIESTMNPRFKNKIIISEFLMDCGLEKGQFKIFDDLSVDIFAAVNMTYRNLRKIPFKINRCTSQFDCSHNLLVNLVNCPTSVHGNFNCSYNMLKSLVGGPTQVSGAYNCSFNQLTSLKGAPLKVKVFNCSNNSLLNHHGAPIATERIIK